MSHFFSLNLFIPLYNGGDWDRSLALLGNSLKVCGDISDCHRDGSGVYWHLVGGDQRMMVFCTRHPESVPSTFPQVGKNLVCSHLGLEPNSVLHVHSSHCFMVTVNFQERQVSPQWKKAYIDTLFCL